MEDMDLQNQSVPTFFSDKNKKKVIFYFISIIIFFVLAYFLFFSAPSSFPVGTILNIKDGSSLTFTAKSLEENNIIRSKVFFKVFSMILGGDKNIVSGDYLFEKKISVFEVARRIVRGERHLAPVKITIPEGFNNIDIAKLIALKLPNFKVNNFLKEAQNKEGYLFPDTYFFLTTDNEKDVLEALSNNFEKKISALKSEITNSQKTEREILIMASLIEAEAKGEIDRGYISGILWNRIRIGMPLQVDADFSTYKNKGLPENPICNPGLKAIKAAIYPQKSNYLYYLHDKDGNIHYATTFAEHKINKQKYLDRKI